MKQLLALLLCIAVMLSLVACGEAYPPVKSTEEELRTVMTLTVEGKTYDVKYELYRAFALMYRDDLSEGDNDPWDDPARVADLHARVSEQIYEIYTILALCEKHDIDLYSKEYDEQVEQFIRVSIEGDEYFEGYGSYDAYLAALKESYLNYATSDLLYRYSLGQQALYSYYQGTYDYITDSYKNGAITVTDADVDAYYNDEDTARVMLIYLSAQLHDDADVALKRSTLLSKLGEGGREAMIEWLYNHTTVSSETINGEMLSRYNFDDFVYSDVIEQGLALEDGEMSEPVRVAGDDVNGYYLIYRMEKTPEHLAGIRSDVRDACLLDKIGERFHETKTALRASRTDAPLLSQLDIATMTMN